MKEKDLMLSGNLYIANDEELWNLQIKKHQFLDEFNNTASGDFA